MKIAIVVHSLSGNTRKFADCLFNRLTTDGHIVNLTQLETTVPIKGGTARQKMDISFTNLPNVADAELILFGGPVWAFGPSPVIIAAIKQMGNLRGKTVIPFACMGFPLKGMGGKAAISWMSRTAGTLGAKILPGGICCQMMHNLDTEIAVQTEQLAKQIR